MSKIRSLFFENQKESWRGQLFLALSFFVFTIVALGVDSLGFKAKYFDGRNLTNLLAISYFLIFFYFSGAYLKKLLFVMVPLSYIGELIFCKLLGFYDYSTIQIPLYVPFGHAIVYASGYVIAHTEFAKQMEEKLRKIFFIGFVLLFLGTGIFLKDYFTLLFGVFFFLLLKRKKWENLYYFIALCVIFIELTGTYFGCWQWKPEVFNFLKTCNPPMGAVFFYAGGDVLLAKIVFYWKKE
ncbi:MAG: hypothetical protein QM535_04940 [Limnohabitans sp.]|nr:hypothetical protein [Limnohabitans sp.]